MSETWRDWKKLHDKTMALLSEAIDRIRDLEEKELKMHRILVGGNRALKDQEMTTYVEKTVPVEDYNRVFEASVIAEKARLEAVAEVKRLRSEIRSASMAASLRAISAVASEALYHHDEELKG